MSDYGDAQTTLDLRGLKCPFPVLRVRKAMQDLPQGAIVVATADDPAAAIDFPHFCNEAGHRLVDQQTHDEAMIFTIAKGLASSD